MKLKMYIKKLSQTRKASEDMENTITLACEDSQVMALSAFESDTIFDVTIVPESQNKPVIEDYKTS